METNKLVGSEIKNQLDRDSLLEKPYHFGDAEVEKVLKDCQLTPELEKRLLAFAGRNHLHMLRLLRRSETERNFALAFIRYHKSLFRYRKSSRAITSVIGAEGADTMMFWTFSPYLFKVLREKGLTEFKALKIILNWSKDGVSTGTEINKPRGSVQCSWHDLHLLGLSKFEEETYGGWVLNPDPNHVSHTYTEQEARIIAELLLADQQPKGNNP